MSDNDSQDRTLISSTNAIRGVLKQVGETPAALVCLIGPPGYAGKQWLLTKEEMIIGRLPECDIFIEDGSISRTHAKVSISTHDVTITDMNSLNKTTINDVVLAPLIVRKLANDDKIKIGNVILRYFEQGSLEVVANQHLLDKSQKDALTGAFSKGALLEKAPELIKRSSVLNEPLTVITFDIDFFKKINDGFGHPGGDYVLRELGQVINTNLVRANDFFARYGGEEFVLILQATNIKTGTEVADRIRQTIEMHNFVFENKKVPVTISIGVAQLNKSENWEQVYDRADKALYQSKQNGRNQVTVAK